MIKPSSSKFQIAYAVGGNSSQKFREPQSPRLKELAELELLRLQKTLEAFRTKRLNVLVSTSVLEEGIDITQCNLVIRFDKIQEFRSYVQSKGRARSKPSQYLVMVEKGGQEAQWNRDLRAYRMIEDMSIDGCHNEPSDENDEEDEEEVYFADPDDPMSSPRITGKFYFFHVSSCHWEL